MKTFASIFVLAVIGFGIWWWGGRTLPAQVDQDSEVVELCFAKSELSPDRGFLDKYILRMTLMDGQTTGVLKILPAEKDALVGGFAGSVENNVADLLWSVEGEVMAATEELQIILGDNEATIAKYELTLPAISCEDLTEREAVETYLWENIATLSPIAPVLGGNWYVVSADIDLENNSGTATYEDGHIQETRRFSYVLSAAGRVESLTIE